MKNLYNEIWQDLGPLFCKADLIGMNEDILQQIKGYLDKGKTSRGTPIPEEAKLKVLNGEW